VDEQRILAEWFGVLADATHGDIERFDVGVAATTDLTEIAWRVAGPTERFLPAVIDACDFVGASRRGRIQLEQVGLALAPATIGVALQVGGAGIDAEWFIPERIDVDELAGLTLPSDMADLVARDRRPLLAISGGLGASAHLGVVR